MSRRTNRLEEEIREEVAKIIASELKDPRIGFVTVTDVKTSPDLRHARVYVTVLGDEAQRSASLEGLQSAHGLLQRRIAGELRMKRTPTLRFVYDDTTDRAMHIEELLSEEDA